MPINPYLLKAAKATMKKRAMGEMLPSGVPTGSSPPPAAPGTMGAPPPPLPGGPLPPVSITTSHGAAVPPGPKPMTPQPPQK